MANKPDSGPAGELEVEVVWATAESCLSKCVRLQQGATAAAAVEASGLLQQIGLTSEQLAGIGIWGRHLDGKHRLSPDEYCVQHGDRVELYRHLPVSPGQARRRRAAAARADK